MLQIAEKLHAVVVDEDDHKYLLPSDLMNPSWAKSSPTDKNNLYGKNCFQNYKIDYSLAVLGLYIHN